jgi:hypothetical protein
VVRPASDTNVTLTATLSKGEASDTKNFTVKVIAAEVVTTPQQAIDALVITGDTLELAGMIYSTTSNIVIPTTSLGFTVNWVSTSSVITVAGVVTRPEYGAANERVILTASIGDVERDFIIDVIAIQEKPADDVLSEALTALLLPTAATAESIALPTQLTIEGLTVEETYLVSITWASDSVHMNTTGQVDRPNAGEDDALVNLTATLSFGGKTVTKEFSIVVYAYTEAFTVVANINAAKALYAAADSAAQADGVYVRIQDLSLVMKTTDGLLFVDSEGEIIFAFGSLSNAYRNAVKGVRYDVIGALDVFFGSFQISATKNSRKPTEIIVQEGQGLVPNYGDAIPIGQLFPATQPTYNVSNMFQFTTARVTARVIVTNALDNYGVVLVDPSYTGDGSDLSIGAGSGYENRAAFVYYTSNKDVFIPLNGLEVTVDVVLYSFRTDRLTHTVVFGGTIDDIEVGEIADEDLMAMTKATITSSIPTIIPTATSLNLIDAYLSADIEWATSNAAVISLAGVVTPPAEGQVEVTLTATITAGALTEDLVITILVGQLPLSTLEQALEAAANTPLRVEVTIIGYSANNTVIVHDGTHAIAVFIGGGTTLDASTVIKASFGQRVILEGSKTVFNGLQQIQNVTAVQVLTTAAHTPLSVDITGLAWDAATLVEHQSKLVSITGAEISAKAIDSNGNITVTVKLGEKTIVLRWDARIAITGTNVLVNAEIGDLIDIVNAPLGWNQNAPQLGYYVSTQAVVTTNPNLEIFTVTFMDGETELKTEDVVEGRSIASYPASAKEGFIFLGWFTDATLETPWVDGPITEDVTLYAGYEEISGTLVVDTYAFTSLANASTYVLEPTNIDVNGMTFTRLNANISASGDFRGIVLGIRTGNGWNSPYLQLGEKLVGAYKVVFNVTNWTSDARFNLAAFAEGIYIQTSTDGTTWVDGPNFKDTWVVDDYGQNKIELLLENDVYVRLFVRSAGTQEGTFQLRLIVGSVEVHSYVELEEPVTVTFDQNFGDAEPVVVTLSSGELAVEPAAPSRSGFDFLGWFEVEATEAFDFTTPITTDIVLEARWEEQVVTLMSIADVLASPDGTLVNFIGTITGFTPYSSFGTFDAVFMEDETGSIYIHRSSLPETISIGDTYEVNGELDIFNGLIQIAQAGQTYEFISSGNPISEPTVVTDLSTLTVSSQASRINLEGVVKSVSSSGQNLVITVGGTDITIRSMSNQSAHPINTHFLTAQVGQVVTATGLHVGWFNSAQLIPSSPAQVTFADPSDADVLLAQQTAMITYFDGNSFDMDTLIAPSIELDGTVVEFSTEPANAIVDNTWMVVTEDTAVVVTITLTRGEEAPVEFDVEVTILFVEAVEPGEGETFVETFTDMTMSGSSYGSGSHTGVNGQVWSYTDSRGDLTLDGKALLLRAGSLTTTFTNGLSALSFEYDRAFTGTGARSFEIYINGVLVDTVTVLATDNERLTYTNNTLNYSGNVDLEIKGIGAQKMIDNISWTTNP